MPEEPTSNCNKDAQPALAPAPLLGRVFKSFNNLTHFLRHRFMEAKLETFGALGENRKLPLDDHDLSLLFRAKLFFKDFRIKFGTFVMWFFFHKHNFGTRFMFPIWMEKNYVWVGGQYIGRISWPNAPHEPCGAKTEKIKSMQTDTQKSEPILPTSA